MAGLKLRVADEQDLAVVSAILQDSLVTVREMAYLPEENRFVLVANRFRWEPGSGDTRENLERILTGFCIDDVKAVQRRGFDPREPHQILSLLAIRVEPAETGATLVLDFAGGSSIRLDVGAFACRLDDLGEPWPTQWRPQHPVADAD